MNGKTKGRGLDHLVLACRDLAAQARLYADLGFTVGARNRHPWGTVNHIVQMPGCFLELLSKDADFVPPAPDAPVAPFAGFLAAYLARREGLAMVVLESADAARDQADFAAAGIAGPATFHFGRRGTRPDGSSVEVAFTLAFARTPAITEAGFFVCQQHYPENFWAPALQQHANGVTGLAAVVLAAAEPRRHEPFLAAFTGVDARTMPGGVRFVTPRGAIDVVDIQTARRLYGGADAGSDPDLPRFVAVRFRCPDPDAVAGRAGALGAPVMRDGARVVLDAAACFGVALAFEPDAEAPG